MRYFQKALFTFAPGIVMAFSMVSCGDGGIGGVNSAPVANAGPAYIWPLSKGATPDEMDTSFGPRINFSKWDFHDGIDLPAPKGTPVYAMRAGTIYREGPGGTDGYSSRHVILKVDDPADGTHYLVYLHLDSIDFAIAESGTVVQGQLLGTVGDDDASHPHLHMEFRKNSPMEAASVHPLGYLPYSDTNNWTAPLVPLTLDSTG